MIVAEMIRCGELVVEFRIRRMAKPWADRNGSRCWGLSYARVTRAFGICNTDLIQMGAESMRH